MNIAGAILVIMLPLTQGMPLSIENCPKALPRDQHLTVFGDYCYRFLLGRARRDYHTAEKSCELDGGTLAVVKSAQLSNFLYHQLDKVYHHIGMVYIGLNNVDSNGDYIWIDGSHLRYGSFQNWADGFGPRSSKKPGSSLGILMDTSKNGQWVDEVCPWEPCSGRKAFICQYKPTTTTTSTSTTTTTTTTAPTTPSRYTPEPTCPPFVCVVDCGMDGYTLDEHGCSVCACDVK